MTDKGTMLIVLCTCLQMARGFSPCNIFDTEAHCGGKGLKHVPPLPYNVTFVDLNLNYISEVNETSFLGLEDLQIIILQQQDTSLVLKNNAFNMLTNLTILDLGFNSLIHLEPKAFSGLVNLQKLILTNCKLNETILSGDYLEPLVSLEMLALDTNHIERILPAKFFFNMPKLHMLDLSHNRIKSICEEDFFGFQGKHFALLNLNDIKLTEMSPYWSEWDQCGNPFRNISIGWLDLSLNGLSVDILVLFFKAIRGTKISALILKQNSGIGQSIGFKNIKDPEKNTFIDLADSGVQILDLSKCSIFSLANSLFAYLPDLVSVSLASNVINTIENNAFFGVPHLQELNLSNNLLDKINSNTFEHLHSLKMLDLSYNNLRTLLTDSFKGLSNLDYLDLSENSLQTVHKLATLPKIQVLNLSNNRIRSLYNLQNTAYNVTDMDLSNNSLTNVEYIYDILEDFPKIQVVSFEGNAFLWCFHNRNYSVSPSNNLLKLNLKKTGLPNAWSQGKCLDVFDKLHQLKILLLPNNYMQSIPKNIFKGLISLLYLDLSFNSLTYIPKGIFPESLRILDLSHNHLGSVDPQALSKLSDIGLYGNRFLCDCSLKEFQTWLNTTNVAIDSLVDDLICEFPEEQRGIPLVYSVLCEDEELEESVEMLKLTLFICCTAFILVTLTCTIIHVRLRGYCFKLYRKMVIRFMDGSAKPPADDGFLYDVYLCFSPKDISWVMNALLKKLDTNFSENNTIRCCFEARDFLPGEDHLSNMRNAVWNSKKVLCVVSREFLKDGWCLEAFTLAQSKMLEEVQDVLLVLLIDNIPQYKLMKYEPIRTYIRTRRYFCWPEDSQDLQWFYNQLSQCIIKGSKGKQVRINAESNQKRDTEAVTSL
ncbi:toll-like receptor 5 isoform X2 [Hoplias malabaricus]